MSVKSMEQCPEPLSYLPQQERFEWYSLCDEQGEYAVAAVAEIDAKTLELHLEVTHWGLRARKGLVQDMDWLKQRARSQGKQRILGLKGGWEIDPLWPKFTKLFGFSGHAVVQTAQLELGG